MIRDKQRVEKIVSMIIGGVILAILLAVLFGYVFMLLWNWLMPMVFGLPEVGYWEACGIFLLSKLIFGFGGSDHSHSGNNKSESNWEEKLERWLERQECHSDNHTDKKEKNQP